MKKSTCVYLIQDGRWLMLYRNRKANDVNHGKWIGVGGKVEGNETFEACARREVLEETGLITDQLTLCGMVDFLYDTQEPEQIAIYTCEAFHGTLRECDEGTLAWIDEDKILDLPLWEGDRIFLKQMLENDPNPFCIKLIYDDQGNLLQALRQQESTL
ncbi:MAG: 8-oxo-dGTP diphosphatase [Solobacterium sp.]|nr:8-oxo-dGTP diphosphatase [Solobacterium sp.]